MENAFYTYITIKIDEPKRAYVGFTTKEISSGYIGSGKLIVKAIKKYGKNAFARIDLGVFESIDEALYWEGFYIKTLKTEFKYGGYNIHPSGAGVPNPSINGGEVWNKGKKCPQLSGENNGMYRNTQTEEGKKRISNARKGKSTWKEGQKMSEEGRKNISKSKKGKTHKGVPHTEKTKKHLSDVRKQLYAEGKIDTSGEKNGMYGKTPWNKGLTGSQNPQTGRKRGPYKTKIKQK